MVGIMCPSFTKMMITVRINLVDFEYFLVTYVQVTLNYHRLISKR